MNHQLLIIAKQPVAGKVKTRLCPPCSPEHAALVAAASLSDTVHAVANTSATHRTLVLAGDQPNPSGFRVVKQRGGGLAERLVHAFEDTALPNTASLLIGMDTPQVTPRFLTAALDQLTDVDAVLGLAQDGGWWALGLRHPQHGRLLRDVPMSTDTTGACTLNALYGAGLRVAALPTLRDVDTADDARIVAAQCRGSAFDREVRRWIEKPEVALW